MKIFQCQNCAHPVVFENTLCESCGHALGYLSDRNVLTALRQTDEGWEALADPGGLYYYCENRTHEVCNWLVPATASQILCQACLLNRTTPNLGIPDHVLAWRKLEIAKHRLVYGLLRLGLPIASKTEEPETGLAFDFLSDELTAPQEPNVQTGHAQGLITINIAEADAAHREKTRLRMGEPYRTLIGHFRHEVGHYYWERLVQPDEGKLDEFRHHFGDEREDYAAALKRHYDNGPPSDWRKRFVSGYAASHAWEDWAETWAHYLHLVDTFETAHAFGMQINPPLETPVSLSMKADFDPYGYPDFDAILAACLPLTFAVNSLNRSMGQPDLYPFVLPPPVIEKLRFVHQLLRG